MGKIHYVGMDVHKETIQMSVLRGSEQTPTLEKEILNTPAALKQFFEKFEGPEFVVSCYEAGCFGFEIHRQLKEMGISCHVVAPGRLPRKASDRVKTDRRDARNLANLLRGGFAQSIHVPSEEDESLRDLLRCREDLRIDLARSRQRLHSFLLRHGLKYISGKKHWTLSHKKWLSTLRFENTYLNECFSLYWRRVEELSLQLKGMDEQVEAIAHEVPYAESVSKLMCLKGLGALTALSLVCEVGDFKRFNSAGAFMSFLGLVPQERSSGSSRWQGAITKCGNSHLRRLLIESSWSYRYVSSASVRLEEKRKGQDAAVVIYAQKATKRLEKKYRQMTIKGNKNSKVAITAVARELSGFIWGMMTQSLI